MTRTPIKKPWAEDEIGTYWTTPREASLAEAHPPLMGVLLMMPGHQEWSVLSVEAYDMGSGGRLARLILLRPKERRDVRLLQCRWLQAGNGQAPVVAPLKNLRCRAEARIANECAGR